MRKLSVVIAMLAAFIGGAVMTTLTVVTAPVALAEPPGN